MQLIIKKNQSSKTGLFGNSKGMKFNLSCQIKINQSDIDLIDKYKVLDHVLLEIKYGSSKPIPSLTIKQLIEGTTYEVSDVSALLKKERDIKGACNDFKLLLEVMANFGGEEIIEI